MHGTGEAPSWISPESWRVFMEHGAYIRELEKEHCTQVPEGNGVYLVAVRTERPVAFLPLHKVNLFDSPYQGETLQEIQKNGTAATM
ncbi:hypothetical protein SAMN05216343_11851 [Oscillibacter sp. PC13]|nr:hypothetical protein SAMN05216343_11851 [Oscillibacter sp. PC13]